MNVKEASQAGTASGIGILLSFFLFPRMKFWGRCVCSPAAASSTNARFVTAYTVIFTWFPRRYLFYLGNTDVRILSASLGSCFFHHDLEIVLGWRLDVRPDVSEYCRLES